MTRSERRPSDQTRPSTDRYRQFATRDALVVYDREDTSRWLQSDTVRSLAEMR